MNKHGVSRKWFTEADVRDFKSGRIGIKGSWFVNHNSISWSQEAKIHKTSIVHESFLPRYENFKIISVGDISLSICLE